MDSLFLWQNTSYDNELWHLASKRTVGRVWRARDEDGEVIWEAKAHWMPTSRVFRRRTTAKMFLRAEAKRYLKENSHGFPQG